MAKKNKHAVMLGRKGGKARKGWSRERRVAAARHAIAERWKRIPKEERKLQGHNLAMQARAAEGQKLAALGARGAKLASASREAIAPVKPLLQELLYVATESGSPECTEPERKP